MEMALCLRGISKSFSGYRVLDSVDFSLSAGQIHAVVGENGAGKSVLMKVIAGIEKPDSGEIQMDGRSVLSAGYDGRRKMGIHMIGQGMNLVETMTVLDNLFLNDWMMKRGGLLISRKRQYEKGRRLLKELGLDPGLLERRAGELELDQKKMIEVAKSLLWDSRILIMDEVASFLNDVEKDRLFSVMRRLAQAGTAIIFISHDAGDIDDVADMLWVMHQGRLEPGVEKESLSSEKVAEVMADGAFVNRYPRLQGRPGRVLMKVEELTVKNQLYHVNFELRGGEILGLAGMADSGREALAEAIGGVRRPDGGRIRLPEQEKRPWSRKGQDSQIAYMPGIPGEGLVGGMNVTRNITLSHMEGVQRSHLLLSGELEEQISEDYARRLGFQQVSGKKVRELSGGTAQKVLISKGLFSQAKIFVFHEPTAYLDIASRVEVYNLMNELALQGYGVIFISSDLDELAGMCHRILVFYKGRITGSFQGEEISKTEMMKYVTGVMDHGETVAGKQIG